MAATDLTPLPPAPTRDTPPPRSRGLPLGGLVLAACALPGVMPAPAQAEEAPEQRVVALKLSGYQEHQAASAEGPGGTRIGVTSPSAYLLLPLGRQWAVEGSLTVDEVSGASPRYYSDLSGASHMQDRRTAVDARLTRYFDRQAFSLGLARSSEHDYLSQAVSVEGRFASDDQNTTWNVGLGWTGDRIDPTNGRVAPTTRHTREFQVGVTQALTRRDLLQASMSLSRAQGYLSDPYKLYDQRPDRRHTGVLQLRWNHALDGSVLKTGYRFYKDSYQVQAHTWDLAWVLPLRPDLSLTPSLRYHTQRAARFYFDPVADTSVYPAPRGNPTWYSNDQRLSAFGALSVGGKLQWQPAPQWTVDLKLELYQQRSAWRLGGDGSPGIDPLSALLWQAGVSHAF